jgi:hypothetical protein
MLIAAFGLETIYRSFTGRRISAPTAGADVETGK